MVQEHFDHPPTQKESPLGSSIGQADLTTENPRTSRIHEKIRGFRWSTRPDSNWHSLRGLRPLILATRSSLASPPSVGNALNRKGPNSKPNAELWIQKEPALLRRTSSFCIWSTRPDSNWRPSRWQRVAIVDSIDVYEVYRA